MSSFYSTVFQFSLDCVQVGSLDSFTPGAAPRERRYIEPIKGLKFNLPFMQKQQCMIHNGTLKSFVGSRTPSFLIIANTGLPRKDETLKTKKKLYLRKNLSFRVSTQQTKITLKWSSLLPSRSRVLDEFQNGFNYILQQSGYNLVFTPIFEPLFKSTYPQGDNGFKNSKTTSCQLHVDNQLFNPVLFGGIQVSFSVGNPVYIANIKSYQ